MKTLEQIAAEHAETAKLDVCCQKCEFFGRGIHHDREPSGQCCRCAPAIYHVLEVTTFPLGKLTGRNTKEIEVPFPGVWPWDFCGDFKPAPPDAAPAPGES